MELFSIYRLIYPGKFFRLLTLLELMMKIEGLSHVTFVVEDLERMAIFLCEGLGAEEVYDSKAKNFSISREKFFVLGGFG